MKNEIFISPKKSYPCLTKHRRYLLKRANAEEMLVLEKKKNILGSSIRRTSQSQLSIYTEKKRESEETKRDVEESGQS